MGTPLLPSNLCVGLDPAHQIMHGQAMINLIPARHRTRPFLGCIASCFFAVLLVAAASLDAAHAQSQPDVRTASSTSGQGAGSRRYLSLKADRVVLRQGPGPEHPESWIFSRTGLPVEVVEESEVWRKVRDAGGTEGWVHSSLLSGRRTALVLPWEAKDNQAQPSSTVLREGDRENARPVVQVEAGVLANIIACGNGWCRVSVGNYRGYIEQNKLWGTYPNEEIKP
jgi:SH3-like domain-containing protein